jgi:signal transduction histidine kinase/CheY-like chemotaxis protein
MRFRVLRPDGALRHVELQGVVHDDPIGRAEWSIGVAGDYTDIVQATAESEQLRAQLQQSQKMEALGTLAAGVAHDFNNLLTGINGFVELASTSLAPGHEAGALLQQARRGAMSARDLVRRILNFSRTKVDRARARIDLASVVRDTAPLIAAALPGNVSLSVTVDCAEAPVMADGGQMQQILMNLCTNGAHAIGTRAGKIQIRVQLCELGSASFPAPAGCSLGRHVRLSVTDTGSGMDEATRRRIFEPFFTTKQPGEGTGLGLSIVQDIVKAHEGGLGVESTPGVGTTFAIYLPFAQSEGDVRPVPVPPAITRGAGQRILIVDDEPSVGMVVRLTLQKSGYEPESYASPAAAWQRFEADPGSFSLLIVDQNMPEIGGVEFVGRARALRPELPVILMSGRFENTHGAAVLDVARLRKPFEIVELIGAVKTALVPPDQSPG